MSIINQISLVISLAILFTCAIFLFDNDRIIAEFSKGTMLLTLVLVLKLSSSGKDVNKC